MEPILIIDDELEVAELLERFLRMEGFPVAKAHDGTQGIAMMHERFFNIVLCDIRLPDIDGKDLIGRLKEYNPLVNIVMITGYSSMDNVVSCLGGGAVDYFTKPFREVRLVIETVKALDAKIARWKKFTPILSSR